MRLAPLALLLLVGCTDRLLSIRSEPEGATAYLDGRAVGVTPCEVPFVWYGGRELVLEKEGYRSRTEILDVAAPWWQYPVLDFITDVLLPFTLTDRREFSFPLEPQSTDPGRIDEIRKRAEELRLKARENQ
jgi:hypothetical protein